MTFAACFTFALSIKLMIGDMEEWYKIAAIPVAFLSFFCIPLSIAMGCGRHNPEDRAEAELKNEWYKTPNAHGRTP